MAPTDDDRPFEGVSVDFVGGGRRGGGGGGRTFDDTGAGEGGGDTRAVIIQAAHGGKVDVVVLGFHQFGAHQLPSRDGITRLVLVATDLVRGAMRGLSRLLLRAPRQI